MKRLAIASTDSAAGNLKASRILDRSDCVTWNPADWPGPAADDLESYLFARSSILTIGYGSADYTAEDPGAFAELLDRAAAFDRVELWFDPDLNGQLALCLAITEIARRPLLFAKTVTVPLSISPGEVAPDWTAACSPTFLPVTSDVAAAAQTAWRAFTSPTPQAWRNLLDADVSSLPCFGPVRNVFLSELPDARAGLSTTQRVLLEAATKRPPRLLDILAEVIGQHRSPLGYWRVGQIFLDLFTAATPALRGASERIYDAALHEDAMRYADFRDSVVTVTTFGEALLKGETDWCAANPIDRWWGGTHLTSDNLWRWDARARTLIAP